jgi:hypothetical protein
LISEAAAFVCGAALPEPAVACASDDRLSPHAASARPTIPSPTTTPICFFIGLSFEGSLLAGWLYAQRIQCDETVTDA